MKIGIFSLTSAIHDLQQLEKSTDAFLSSISNCSEHYFIPCDLNEYGRFDLDVIFVRTGGTEGVFKDIFPRLAGPVILLASGSNNSLAASMEIASFLRSEGRKVEIVHGESQYIARRLDSLVRISLARKSLAGKKYGVIGEPSDWLISSDYDRDQLRSKIGIELVDIPMDEFLYEIQKKDFPVDIRSKIKTEYNNEILEGALCIYGALGRIVERYELSGLTVRCFDLLGTVRNTSCLALAIFNSQGIIAGCEGDVPSMVSMAVVNAITGQLPFQANPSSIDVYSSEVVFAHCTVPLGMVKEYVYDSHFESGLGVAVRGVIPTGEATVFKTDGALNRQFISDAQIIANQSNPNLCRTQIRVKLQEGVKDLLTKPIGNHHIIVTGHYAALLKEFFDSLSER